MPKLPSIVSQLPQDLKQFLERVREAFTTSGVDRFVTARDLIGSGIALDNNLTPGATGEVYGVPPAPTNVIANGALANVMVEWDRPVYRGHSHAEVWAAEVDDLGQAVQVGMAPGAIFVHNIGGAAVRYYWVRFINLNGVAGAYNAVAGVRGETGQDPGYLLELLTGEITESQLYQDLGARINLIDADYTVPGSVSQRVFAEAVIWANAISAEAATREAAITAEATVRQSVDESLSQQITTLTASLNDNTAAIQTEAATRASADSSEASYRETLASQLRGSYTGNDLNALTSGLIYAERLVRSTQTENLANSISALSVGTAQGIDAYVTYYFDDGTTGGWVGSGLTVLNDFGYLSQSAITGTPATTTYIQRTELSFSGGKYNTIRLRVKRVSGSGWTWKITFQANGSWQTGVTAGAQTVAVGDVATIEFDMSSVPSWMGGTITGIRIYSAATSSDYFDFDYITIGRVGPAASTASVLEEATARVSADNALSTTISMLAATVSGNAASASSALVSEQTARANADSALTQSINATRSSYEAADTTLASAIVSEATTRAAADTTNASAITQVTSRLDNAAGSSVTLEQAFSTQASVNSGLQAQYTVKIDNNGYVSGFGLASTSVNSTPYSSFVIRADKFAISNPSGPSLSPITPFVVNTTAQTINGVSVPAGVYIDAAYIKNGTITNAKIGNAAIDDAKIANLSAAKITAGTVSADRIAANSITGDKISTTNLAAKLASITDAYVGNANISGVIQSSNFVTGSAGWKIDKTGQIEMNNATFRGTIDVKSATSGARLVIKNNVIKVYDSSGYVRVQIGDLTA